MKIPLAILGLLAVAIEANAETLTLHISTSSAMGTLNAAVFTSQQDFDSGQMISGLSVPAQQGVTRLEIPDLKQGVYGISVFHDLDGDEELDTNLFGAPVEPFGFSNNPKIGFSAPKFEAFKFTFDGTPMQLNIILNRS